MVTEEQKVKIKLYSECLVAAYCDNKTIQFWDARWDRWISWDISKEPPPFPLSADEGDVYWRIAPEKRMRVAKILTAQGERYEVIPSDEYDKAENIADFCQVSRFVSWIGDEIIEVEE